jgi:hypothetical protein
MRMNRHLVDQRGGVLVIVAVWMPVLIIMATFTIDAGNWFVHKRHLQMQADAGALAAAREFNACPNSTAITDKAAQYSQDVYNAQIGRTPATRIHRLINSKTFYGQPGNPDDTAVGPPCTAGMVDVKLTETDLPWFFRSAASLFGAVGGSVPYINAQARVSVFQRDTAQGALPIGVPEVNPRAAKAWFVNEKTGAVLGSTPLTKVGTSNGLAIWDNAGAPLPVKVDTSDTDVGVVIALGGGTSTTCGQPLVDCYDAGAPSAASGLPSTGILFVRGWSAAGSGAQPNDPLLRGATLINGSCADPYFSSAIASCTVGVQATVDIGALATTATKLTANVGGTNYAMTYDAVGKVWNTATTIPLALAAGPVGVTLNWEEQTGTLTSKGACTNKAQNPCKGTFGVVQRAFSATDPRSGPIKLAQVLENGVQWANSLERCSAAQTSCTHNLVVRIGVKGNLQNAADKNDPVVVLRIAGGSQTQSVDCDPGKNLRDELATGCTPTYGVNQGTACPENPVPQVQRCVPIETGGKVGQVNQGLEDRIFKGSTNCAVAPNNWASYPNLPAGDPRIIQVLLTPFGTFQGSGNASVPVTGFATFYLTGFNGSPCQGNDEDDVPGKGDIAGHFIKYIDTLTPGSGSTQCDFASLGSCTAVLTR